MPISIDIRDEYIKIIYAEKKNNKIKIKKCIHKDIDETYVRNGYIVGKIDFTFCLSDIINTHNLKGEDCFITLSSLDIIRKEITIPKVRAVYINSIIKNMVVDIFPEEELIIDYKITGEIKKDEKELYKVTIYGVPEIIVNDYKSLLNNVGIVPKGLNILSNTIEKVSKYDINGMDISNDIVLFIEVNKSYIIISLLEKGATVYVRTIDISSEVRREELFLDNKNATNDKIQEDSTADIDEDENVISFLDDDDDDKFILENMLFISPILIKIDEEIHKIMQFFMSINNTESISRAYIYGNKENIDEIVEYIDQNIIPGTQKIQKISNINIDKDLDFDISKFLVATLNIMRK